MSHTDNYTDYSCSTSLERLARDVETTLHRWHVTQGSDRHVSLRGDPRRSSDRRLSRSHSSSSNRSVASSAASTASPCWRTDDDRLYLVRSERILWEWSPLSSGSSPLTHDPQDTVRVPLVLSLWDAPLPWRHHTQEPTRLNARAGPTDPSGTVLPCALDRPGDLEDLSEQSLMSSLSVLFGIGQHLTLSLEEIAAPTEESETSGNQEDHTLLLWQALLLETAPSVLQRHASTRVVMTLLQSIWSGWLQSAINMAASNAQCAMPVFGIWAHYDLDKTHKHQQWPWWRPIRETIRASELPQTHATTSERASAVALWQRIQQNFYRNRRRYKPTLQLEQLNRRYLPAVCHGQLVASDCHASFTCRSLPLDPRRDRTMYLSQWADWFRAHVGVETVSLWAAQHGFRCERSDWEHEWRSIPRIPSNESGNGELCKYDAYRRQCEEHILSILKHALGASDRDPLWGPADDPVAAIGVSAAWSGVCCDTSAVVDPLLTFPLQTRSRRMSEADWNEMQQSVEDMILDPHKSSNFHVRVKFDSETPHASLATTLRCVLAALIRAATLPPETMCSHLTDIPLIRGWDNNAGNLVAQSLAESASVSKATQALVAAMEWTHAAVDMIDNAEANDILQNILNQENSEGFPLPPIGIPCLSMRQSLCLSSCAPPGRLFSHLAIYMAKVKSPSSVALLWMTFIEELRERWENKMRIPNMQVVRGFDPVPSFPKTRQHYSVSQNMYQGTTNSELPDPDGSYCLVGQKLQLLNICIEGENLLADEGLGSLTRFLKYSGKRPRLDSTRASSSIPISISRHIVESQSDDEFYDSLESFHELEHAHAAQMEDSSCVERVGAKFPIDCQQNESPSRTLLYAPILQRAYPLTDDILAERRLMVERQGVDGSSLGLGRKLELIHRFQQPKLFSDMQAFKAANPGCTYDDFLAWYGNPADPFAEYRDGNLSKVDTPNRRRRSSRAESVKETTDKLDKVADSIRAINATREFWEKLWEIADPVSAADQPSLFDCHAIAEMTLNYLETIHPACLLCQVMAANFNAAYFALVASAGVAIKMNTVSHKMEDLRDDIENAVSLLAEDVLRTHDDRKPHGNRNLPVSIASTKSIAACERACCAVSEAEVLIARAVSLLNKFPGELHLVENLLRQPGRKVQVLTESSRGSVLSAFTNGNTPLEPRHRQYIFRGDNPWEPSQLSVSFDAGPQYPTITCGVTRCTHS